VRFAVVMTVSLILLFAIGCSGSRASGFSCWGTPYSPSLLFDTRPGFPGASQFACRSAWPCATSFRGLEEVIEYRERFIDRQGNGLWHRGRDRVYRRFDTRRVGRGQR
jgi:hypothetical protein